MASSLAASIENKFGTAVKLIEGHNGIFNVAVNGNLIFVNQGNCNQRPNEEQIFGEIQKYSANLHSENLDEKRRKINIEFLYIDLSVCTRCQGTESNLEEAVAEVAQVLRATGADVNVEKIHVQTEEQARELGFVSSPTIRINGQDIQLEVKENLCESCGDLCGEDVDCRIWTYQGKEYTVPPKGMIIDAILREVYAGTKENVTKTTQGGHVPENLQKFFAAQKRKKENETVRSINSCCEILKDNSC